MHISSQRTVRVRIRQRDPGASQTGEGLGMEHGRARCELPERAAHFEFHLSFAGVIILGDGLASTVLTSRLSNSSLPSTSSCSLASVTNKRLRNTE
jgi:hypothetical protein